MDVSGRGTSLLAEPSPEAIPVDPGPDSIARAAK